MGVLAWRASPCRMWKPIATAKYATSAHAVTAAERRPHDAGDEPKGRGNEQEREWGEPTLWNAGPCVVRDDLRRVSELPCGRVHECCREQ